MKRALQLMTLAGFLVATVGVSHAGITVSETFKLSVTVPTIIGVNDSNTIHALSQTKTNNTFEQIVFVEAIRNDETVMLRTAIAR